jgi:hypothetical protein
MGSIDTSRLEADYQLSLAFVGVVEAVADDANLCDEQNHARIFKKENYYCLYSYILLYFFNMAGFRIF